MVQTMGEEVAREIRNLLQSIDETLKKLAAMPDALLNEKSEHPCAMGGTVRDLLMHNIDHERMHTGSVLTARYELKCLQNSQAGEAARILAEWFRERAALIGALMGLPDEMLDVPWREGKYSIREHVVHTIYWEQDSVESIVRMLDERAAEAAS
jgi:uncharacterized damage-inducible protein DinB